MLLQPRLAAVLQRQQSGLYLQPARGRGYDPLRGPGPLPALRAERPTCRMQRYRRADVRQCADELVLCQLEPVLHVVSNQ